MTLFRKFKREQLKKELGTNNIAEEFHKRYGYKPNKSKLDIKLELRKQHKKRKERRKKSKGRSEANE